MNGTSAFPCCQRPKAYSTMSGLCGARWSPSRHVFISWNRVRMASIMAASILTG